MADDRANKLCSLADGVRSFFEVTNVREGRGWSAAFKAVRSNDYMADSFLAELRSLLDYIEVEFDPRFESDGKGKKVDGPQTAPIAASRGAAKGPPLAEMKTDLKGRGAAHTPALVEAAPKKAAPPPKPAAKVEPPKPSVKPAALAPAKKVVPPPPPPPRRGFVDNLRTSISSPPAFADDEMTEATGRNFIPPVHAEPPKKRK